MCVALWKLLVFLINASQKGAFFARLERPKKNPRVHTDGMESKEIARDSKGKRKFFAIKKSDPFVVKVIVEEKREGEHPYYGKGYSDGYSLQVLKSDRSRATADKYGQGVPIFIHWDSCVVFDMSDLSVRGHPFLIGRDPEGGKITLRSDNQGAGVIDFFPTRDFGLTEEEIEKLSSGLAIYTFYYACDIHPYMGGKVYVVGNSVSLDVDLTTGQKVVTSMTPTEYEYMQHVLLFALESEKAIPVLPRKKKKKKKKKTTWNSPWNLPKLTAWTQTSDDFSFDRPVFLVPSYHAEGRFMYFGTQGGKIYEIDTHTTLRGGGPPGSDPMEHAGRWGSFREFMDVSSLLHARITKDPSGGEERGLLGMAFMPLDIVESERGKKITPGDKIPFFVFLSRDDTSASVKWAEDEHNTMSGDHSGCLLRMEAKYVPDVEILAADPVMEAEEILRVTEPYPNHNGGNLVFDPSVHGLLYIGLGDGGSQGDPGYRVQNLTSPMGKVLRIDVTRLALPREIRRGPPLPYDIPKANIFSKRSSTWNAKKRVVYPIYARQKIIARYNSIISQSNPSVSRFQTVPSAVVMHEMEKGGDDADASGLMSPLPEIFVWGVRNPRGISFFPKSGDMILPDVGENRSEEVNIIHTKVSDKKESDHNLGWPWFEGFLSTEHHPETKPTGDMHKIRRRLLFPWFTYRHSRQFHLDSYSVQEFTGRGVIGGFVYTGTRSPKLRGKYIYGDISGWFAALDTWAKRSYDGLRYPYVVANGKLPEGHMLMAFAQSLDGEVYALSQDTSKAVDGGQIWQIQWDE